jgi:hypothetical protein
MAQKQFNLTHCERIAVQDLVEREKEYVERRNQITADILMRLGLGAEVRLDIANLEKGIVVATIPEPEPKPAPKLVDEEEDPAPAQTD